MKIQKSPFTCVRDGLVIRGTMYKPEEKQEQLPIAVISHGFMANQLSVVKYAKALARWGYAAFCFDFNGGCIRGKSDGKTTDMSVLTEREDLKAVISYAKSLAFTDEKQLILMGCSPAWGAGVWIDFVLPGAVHTGRCQKGKDDVCGI